jgi:hypothetical protein
MKFKFIRSDKREQILGCLFLLAAVILSTVIVVKQQINKPDGAHSHEKAPAVPEEHPHP